MGKVCPSMMFALIFHSVMLMTVVLNCINYILMIKKKSYGSFKEKIMIEIEFHV